MTQHDHFTETRPFEQADTGDGPQLRATPYRWQDPATLPRRQWVYGRHLIRKFLSVTVAPGAVGKSSLELVEAIAMATGRPLLGVRISEPLKVWYWGGEDPIEELERRVAAILLHYAIDREEVEGRLFLNSGRDSEIIIATADARGGARIARPVVDSVIAAIRADAIDVVMIDPFVSSHRVNENDNPAIDLVAKTWAEIADATNSAIDLVHHVRKGQSGQGEWTVEDGRGAGALLAATRSARVLNRMTVEEARDAQVENRLTFFRVSNGKANLAPASDGRDWFQLVSVPLGNDGRDHDSGDRVAVVAPWSVPDAMSGVTAADLRAVQKEVAAGRWRENHQAKDWVGRAVAGVLHLDPVDDRRKILTVLKAWMATGMFVVVEAEDEKRMKRTFVEVGQWAS